MQISEKETDPWLADHTDRAGAEPRQTSGRVWLLARRFMAGSTEGFDIGGQMVVIDVDCRSCVREAGMAFPCLISPNQNPTGATHLMAATRRLATAWAALSHGRGRLNVIRRRCRERISKAGMRRDENSDKSNCRKGKTEHVTSPVGQKAGRGFVLPPDRADKRRMARNTERHL